MLYSRTLLFIHSIDSNLHLLIPNSHSIPPPIPPPWQPQVCSLCLWVYFCSIDKFICVLRLFLMTPLECALCLLLSCWLINTHIALHIWPRNTHHLFTSILLTFQGSPTMRSSPHAQLGPGSPQASHITSLSALYPWGQEVRGRGPSWVHGNNSPGQSLLLSAAPK